MKRRRRRTLLYLYPRSWRRQYGDELLQFLDDLDADAPSGAFRRACSVVLGAFPVQIAHRQPATTVLVFLVTGVIATLDVYGPVNATSRDGVAWGWAWNPNVLIVSFHHDTYVGKGSLVQQGTRDPIVRVRATDRHGVRVTLDCRAAKCTRYHAR